MGIYYHKNYTLWFVNRMIYGGNVQLSAPFAYETQDGTKRSQVYNYSYPLEIFDDSTTNIIRASSDTEIKTEDSSRNIIGTIAGKMTGNLSNCYEDEKGYHFTRQFTLTNSSSEDVLVNSIAMYGKFRYGYSNANYDYHSVLIMTYLFDDPITVPASGSKNYNFSVCVPFIQ